MRKGTKWEPAKPHQPEWAKDEVILYYGNHHLNSNFQRTLFEILLQMYELNRISASFFPLQGLQDYHFLVFVILCAKVEYHSATYLRNQKNLSKKTKKVELRK